MRVGHSFSSKEQVSFNFMATVTTCSDFGAQENTVCHCSHCFPIYLPWSDGTGCHEIKRHLLLGRKVMTKVDSILKSRDITLLTKVHLVKAMVFPVVMYGCESWTIKKAECQRIDAFELWCWNTLESPLDCKEIKPVNPKRNQSWIFIGRADAEAETPILGPPDAKSWLIWKDPDAGKDWRWEEKGMTEDEMVGWHHRLNGREIEQTLVR